MLRTLVRLSLILSSVCLLGGCITMGLHETARTTPKGKVECGVIAAPLIVVQGTESTVEEWPVIVMPYSELSANIGLSDNSDIGFRWAFNPGIGINGKYRLACGGVDVAARLGASFYYYPFGLLSAGNDWTCYSLSPRIVVSREPESGLGWAFNAGLDYYGMSLIAGAEEITGRELVFLGAGAGLPFRPFKSVRLMPEVDVSLPLQGSVDYEGGTWFLPGMYHYPRLSLGISLQVPASP